MSNWSGLISRVTGELDLDALAKETRALVRRRGVPEANGLLRLALARGPSGISLRQTGVSSPERNKEACYGFRSMRLRP